MPGQGLREAAAGVRAGDGGEIFEGDWVLWGADASDRRWGARSAPRVRVRGTAVRSRSVYDRADCGFGGEWVLRGHILARFWGLKNGRTERPVAMTKPASTTRRWHIMAANSQSALCCLRRYEG
jgi:hypothetical protein